MRFSAEVSLRWEGSWEETALGWEMASQHWAGLGKAGVRGKLMLDP